MSYGQFFQIKNVYSLWKLEDATDSSGNGHTLTAAVGSPVYHAGFKGGMVCDGNDRANYAGCLALSGDYTFAVWFKAASAPSSGSAYMLWEATKTGSGVEQTCALCYRNNSGTLQIAANCGATSYYLANFTNFAADLGTTWHMIGLVRSGSTHTVYLDGKALGTLSGGNNNVGGSGISLAGSTGLGLNMNGALSNFIAMTEAKSAVWFRQQYGYGRGLC
jgi:hypothetical protein